MYSCYGGTYARRHLLYDHAYSNGGTVVNGRMYLRVWERNDGDNHGRWWNMIVMMIMDYDDCWFMIYNNYGLLLYEIGDGDGEF